MCTNFTPTKKNEWVKSHFGVELPAQVKSLNDQSRKLNQQAKYMKAKNKLRKAEINLTNQSNKINYH
jgi:cell division protein FtsB